MSSPTRVMTMVRQITVSPGLVESPHQPGRDVIGTPVPDESPVERPRDRLLARLRSARERVQCEPSSAQRDAGNFRKGHVIWKGFDLTIENPKGSTRRKTGPDGREWSREMRADYGYFKRTTARDGDHLDFYMGPDPESEFVYVVNQVKPDSGRFDEHKVMLGCRSVAEARELYLEHYPAGWKGLESGRAMTVDDFRDWISGDLTKRAREGHHEQTAWLQLLERARSVRDNTTGSRPVWYCPQTDHLLVYGPERDGEARIKLAAMVSYSSAEPPIYPDDQDGRIFWIRISGEPDFIPATGSFFGKSASAPRTVLQHLGWTPGQSGLGRFASPMTAMLATGALGAGLGYGGGKLLETAIPDNWERGRLAKTLALLGGLGGAALPAFMLGLPNVVAGKGLADSPILTDGGEDRVDIGPDGHARLAVPESEAGIPQFSKAGSFVTGLAGPPPEIDVDRFLDTIWSDPDVSRRMPPDIQAAATGLIRASQRPGSPTVGMADIGRIAAGMGAGWAAGAMVGKTLGILTGLPDDEQTKLKNIGLWAGVVNQVVPLAFGVRGD